MEILKTFLGSRTKERERRQPVSHLFCGTQSHLSPDGQECDECQVDGGSIPRTCGEGGGDPRWHDCGRSLNDLTPTKWPRG